MQITKMFIIAYAFMGIMIFLLGLPIVYLINTIPTTDNVVLNIIIFLPNLFIYLFNILTFSTDLTITNYILWAIRLIAYIEIALAVRGVNS